MAIGIWLTVHNFSDEGAPTPGLLSIENTYTNVPVSIVSGTAGWHGASITPNAVTIKVSGSPEAMASFDSDRIHAFVNLTGVNAAQAMTRYVDVATPPRVTLLSVNPSSVIVTLTK
ncbi:MAG TPA: CdaR family protein [Verrucomicrobiae bacterium]